MAKVDLYSKNWCDILFEGRNLSYGAYDMRKNTGKRNVYAMIGLMICLAIAFALPFIVEGVGSVIKSLGNDQAMEMQNLQEAEVEQEDEEVFEEKKEETPPDEPEKEVVTEMASTVSFTVPEITDNVKQDKELKSQDEIRDLGDLKISTQDFSGGNDNTSYNVKNDMTELGAVAHKPEVKGTADKAPVAKVEDKKVLTEKEVDQPADFPGGQAAFIRFLQANLNYPNSALEEGIEGTVYVKFVVGTDGNISSVTVTRGVDSRLDGEAKRVVKMVPKWIPGRKDGKPVTSEHTVKIQFTIE